MKRLGQLKSLARKGTFQCQVGYPLCVEAFAKTVVILAPRLVTAGVVVAGNDYELIRGCHGVVKSKIIGKV
jgi:hypothetical protein